MIWALPFWNHAQNWYQSAFGGWQLDGIATLMSGTPFTVFDSNDVAAQGSAPEITGFSAQRPNLVGNPNNGPRTVNAVAQHRRFTSDSIPQPTRGSLARKAAT